MKYFSFLVTVLALMGYGCTSDKVRSFIPGTYINNAGGKFSVASDTLTIAHSAGNNFLIHRSTGFNLIRNGMLGEREVEKEQWNVVYDEATKILTETKKGKLITFEPDSGLLKVGRREYQKLQTK